jgi:hypothetical protein
MYRPDLVQLANAMALRSENVARRLPDLEACAYSDAEALLYCVSDRLHFCSSPDFDDNAEVAYTFPALASNTTYPRSLVTIGPVTTDLLTPSMCSSRARWRPAVTSMMVSSNLFRRD